MSQLFRKSSIERLSSPEQLDKAIVVTSPMSWIVLIGIALIAVCFALWTILGTIPVTLETKGVISNGIYTNTVYSDVSGTIAEINVNEGERAENGKILAKIESSAKNVYEVKADSNFEITKVCVKEGETVNCADELFGISPVSDNDTFVVFYIGAEQAPGICAGMDAVVNMPGFDNQKYGHMKGSVVRVDSYACNGEAIAGTFGANNKAPENIDMEEPMIAVTCMLEKDTESANGLFWSNRRGQELSVNYGNVVDVTVVMDEQAPIAKLVPVSE